MVIHAIVVDDEPLARSVIQQFASDIPDLEIKCSCADAMEAIGTIRNNLIDLIFLDINMPGKNGLDVLKELKENNSQLFVAMISGHNSFENIKRSMDLGADGFVVKPYTSIKIREMIDKFKSGRSGLSLDNTS